MPTAQEGILTPRLYIKCNEISTAPCFVGGGTRSPSVKAWMTEEAEHGSGQGEAVGLFTSGKIDSVASCFLSILLDLNHFPFPFKEINPLTTKQCFKDTFAL